MDFKANVQQKLEQNDYRGAVESILEEMRGLSESHDPEIAKDINTILSKTFDLPNINWRELKEKNVYAVHK